MYLNKSNNYLTYFFSYSKILKISKLKKRDRAARKGEWRDEVAKKVLLHNWRKPQLEA